MLKCCFSFAKEKGRSEKIAPSYQLYLAIKLEILQIRSSGSFCFDNGPDFFLNFLGLSFNLFVLCFVALFEFSDQFTSFDASIIIGAGKIFFDTIDVNIRYNLGVTNINKDINGPKLKKNWLTLSVGYTFR